MWRGSFVQETTCARAAYLQSGHGQVGHDGGLDHGQLVSCQLLDTGRRQATWTTEVPALPCKPHAIAIDRENIIVVFLSPDKRCDTKKYCDSQLALDIRDFGAFRVYQKI